MSHQITTRLGSRVGLVLTAAAIAAPVAQADVVVQSPDSVERNAMVKAAPAIVQSPDSVDRNRAARFSVVVDKRSPDAIDAADPRPVTVQPVIRQVSASGGMDWGDAAIGAGATLGIVLLATGGALTVSRRRHAHLA
jgi:uncharacterized iron-regulated membrane protein